MKFEMGSRFSHYLIGVCCCALIAATYALYRPYTHMVPGVRYE